MLAGSNRMISDIHTYGSPVSTSMRSVFLLPLARQEAEQLMKEPLLGTTYERRFANASANWVEYIWQASGGHPYLIQKLMYCLCECEHDSLAEEDLARCGKQLDDVFEAWYRKFSKRERQLYQSVSELGTVAPGGATKRELMEALPELIDRDTLDADLITLTTMGVVCERQRSDGRRGYSALGTAFQEWVRDADRNTPPTQISEAERRHIENRWHELRSLYDQLTRRIDAVNTQIGRTIDVLARQILEEERQDMVKEREQTVTELIAIEKRREKLGAGGQSGLSR